ncbi:MAG: class I SAM-dependent methyltransferase [Chloroflexota bacterium]|nr:class I SAM-dependent methyltransferase [Chloroflexota bacterium]
MLKNRVGSFLWRYWRAFRGDDVGSYGRLHEYIRTYAPGCSFVDIGSMWGVNGEFAFIAEEAGAVTVKAVDVFGPTPEFEAKKHGRDSSVEFVLGDASHPATIQRVGVMDIVFCAGVLYHHPSPFDLLVALHRMCDKTLILRTSTIPEVDGLPNAAVYYPMLKPEERQLWNLSSLGVGRQVGITDGFEPGEGYGNWFWGMTPSCVRSLLETAGFRVDHRATEPFAQTFICTPVAPPFAHRLPDEVEARRMAEAISEAGIAQPA